MFTLMITSLLIGLAAGFLGGQFGVGGGLITTPAIRLLLQQNALIAVGTPLPIIIPTAIAGFYNYQKNKFVDYKSGLIIGIAGAIFSILGARLTVLVGGRIILLVTALLIAIVSLRFLMPGKRLPSARNKMASKNDNPGLLPLTSSYLILTGIVAGLMSGFLGLGGGIIIIPALTIIFGKNIKEAFGTSLLAIIFIAIPGSIAHYLLGNINLIIALLITFGVIPGAYLGSKFTISMPERKVNIFFGIFLLITAFYLAFNELIFFFD